VGDRASDTSLGVGGGHHEDMSMGVKVIPKVVIGALSFTRSIQAKTRRFRSLLMRWARRHGRDFPWRRTSDPYRTIVAEIMLQRTRSNQVVPIYEQFMERFPTIAALASAPADDVARILRPLGLAFRAGMFTRLAREVIEKYGGSVPTRAEETIALPGAGPYVASAIDAFATKRRLPLIDANIARVLSRIFGLSGGDWRYAKEEQRRVMYEAAALCLGKANPRAYHYAILDFAAEVCTPRSPACPECPMHRAGICVFCETLRQSREIVSVQSARRRFSARSSRHG
jgi:A/G-specific adenine glycosylase